MQVDLTFNEYGLLLQSVNNLKMQQQAQGVKMEDLAPFEALLKKLFQACNTVPPPCDEPEGASDPTFRHQTWNTRLYRFVEPSAWSAAVAAQRKSESTGEKR
jgi:hypothetical protein